MSATAPPDDGNFNQMILQSQLPSNIQNYNNNSSNQLKQNQNLFSQIVTNQAKNNFSNNLTKSMNFSKTIEHEQENQNKQSSYTAKFLNKESFPKELKSYIKLQNEIKRCKPKANILNAYINQKNELIIRSKSKEDLDYIKEPWPKDAFRHGLKNIETKPKFYIALYNVTSDFDVDDEENKSYMLENFKITNMTRIKKKSSNIPTNIIKAILNDREIFNKLIEEKKIKIGHSYIKISPWKFDIQPDQCYHCQKFGHFMTNCPNIKKKPTCLRCAQDHSHKTCKINDPNKFRCANCGEKHSSVSKACSHMIDEIKRKKEVLDKKTKNKMVNTNRVESVAPDQSISSNPQPFIIPIAKLIMFIIDIIKDLNMIQESIYENPQYIIGITTKHFGPLFATIIETYLKSNLTNENKEESTIDSDNEMLINND